MDAHVKLTDSWEEFCSLLDKKCLILSAFCGDGDCEDRVKKDSARLGLIFAENVKNLHRCFVFREELAEPGAPAMGAKSLCIPFKQPKPLSEGQRCVHPKCDRLAKFYTLFGRSY